MDEISSKLSLRYAFVPNSGKSNALNCALDIAEGNLLVFTDDDVSVTPQWLLSLLKASKVYPDHNYFSGRLLSQRASEPPRWFRENHSWHGLTLSLDSGDKFIECISQIRRFIPSVNMAIRKSLFERGLGYIKESGPRLAFGTERMRHGV